MTTIDRLAAMLTEQGQPTLSDLQKSASREHAMRLVFYPARVAAGKMRQAQADHELACQERLLALLEALRLHMEHAGFTVP